MNDHIAKPIRHRDLLDKVAFWTDPSHGPADTAAAS